MMRRQIVLVVVASLQVVAAIGEPASSHSSIAVVSANNNVQNPALRALQQAVTARNNVKDWISAVLTSKNAFDCSASSLKTWTDNCEALAESDSAREQMAAVLTMCEMKRFSSANAPKECLDWFVSAGPARACIE